MITLPLEQVNKLNQIHQQRQYLAGKTTSPNLAAGKIYVENWLVDLVVTKHHLVTPQTIAIPETKVNIFSLHTGKEPIMLWQYIINVTW